MASISVRVMTPMNSAWLPSSMWSLGAGVAEQASRYGVRLNDSMIWLRILPVYALRMLDSSSTTPEKLPGSKWLSFS